MYYQGEAEKKERRKIIAAATVAVVLILILIVAIIVVATKKSSRVSVSNEENASFELKEETKEEKTEEKKEEKAENSNIGVISTEKSEPESEKTETVAKPVETKPTETATKDIPSTGPEEALPIALLMGTLVAYLSSAVLAKREA